MAELLDAPWLERRSGLPSAPWETLVERRAPPRTAAGVLDALQAGYQGSATGLILRGALPDVVLDAHHSTWYEKAAASIGQLIPEIPLMVPGAIGGGTAGTAGGAAVGSVVPVLGTVAGGVAGGVVGAGAGAFAVPAAIRTALVEAYKSGTAQTSGGFLASTGIVIKQTAKEAAVGALTLGAGAIAARAVGSVAAPLVGQAITGQTAARVAGAAGTTAEIGTMVVSGAALEGRLPEWEEFLNAAIVVGGLKASVGMAHKIGEIYARTGVTPEQVVAEARVNPEVAKELVEMSELSWEAQIARNKVQERQVREQLVGKNYEQIDAAYQNAVALNLRVEVEAVGKFLGAEKQAEFDALPNRRAKDRWLDENTNDKMQAWINERQLPEDLIKDFRQAVNDFDSTSPRELGRSIALKVKDADNPDFMLTPEGATFRNALNYAKEQGWSMEDVLAGMRERAQQWAGADAGELFGRLFREAGKSPEPVKLPAPPPELPAPSELPRAFRQAANDESARNAILEPGAARAFVEQPFAEVPQAPGTPKVKLNVNYDYINSPDEAKAALARATELYGPTIVEQTRGKVSWEATEAEARQRLSELTGADVKALLTEREPGTPENAAGLLLRRQLLEGAVNDFTVRARSYDAAKSPPEAAIQMMAAAERVAMLSAYFQGAASEAGRALNILKNARDTARSAEEVKKLLETYDRDPAAIAAIMRQAENPVEAAAHARNIVKATPWEKVVEAMKSFMISGPVTMMANVIGNATFIPLRPVIDAVAIPFNAVRVGIGGSAERMSVVEPVARIVGNWQGMIDAIVLAGRFVEMTHRENRARLDAASGAGDTARAVGENIMAPLRKLDATGGRKTETQKRAIEGDLGVVLRAPFLTLSIPDQLFRLMLERGEANTLAARAAAKEGLTPGSREFMERMSHHRQNLSEKQQEQVVAMGARGTFNADLGRIGRTAQELVKASHTEWIFPFIRTPANIVKELLRLTPAAPIIDTWRADIAKGGAAADKALAEMVVGGAIASVVIGLAQSGVIRGAGTPDPDQKRVKLAAGEQPYSFVDADGKSHEFSRLQPIGTLMGLAADFSEIWDAFEDPQERDKVVAMIGVAFSNAITNQTMLLGLTNVIRAISEPNRFFERWVEGLAGMPVPGIVAQPSQIADPYMREIHGVIDAVKNRTPMRQDLQPKVDIFGEFIENRERVGGIGPVRQMQASDDKVRTEAARLNVSVPKTPEKIQLPGGAGDRKLASVELTPEQQTLYAVVAGKTAHQLLQPLVNAPDWDSRPALVQKMIYDRVFEKARAVTRAQVLPIEQREQEARRIADEVGRRLAAP